MINKAYFFCITFCLFFTVNAVSFELPGRLGVESPWYYVSEDDVELYGSFSSFDPLTNERVPSLGIAPKVLRMIDDAKSVIVASAFLYDILHSERTPEINIVSELNKRLIQKKKENPDFKIIIILDPLNQAYSSFVSDGVRELLDHGIDVFFSDMLSTESSYYFGAYEKVLSGIRKSDDVLGNIPAAIVQLLTKRKIPVSNPLDDNGISIDAVITAALLKANHRKILVVDSPSDWEVMVTSANPHNASIPSANFATTVKGQLPYFVYMNLREDIRKSLKEKSVYWSDARTKEEKKNFLNIFMPEISTEKLIPNIQSNENPVGVKYVTEEKVKESIIKILDSVEPEDEVRIDMFYLSHIAEVIPAIFRAAQKTIRPVRIILDPNKDAFNSVKDGTPNRQFAFYALNEAKPEKNLNLEIRWYHTHGEQNHAKIMSVTNEKNRKFVLFNGSGNWTRKNLDGINMESNLWVDGSSKITIQFNELFDMLWTNSNGLIQTIDYNFENLYNTPAEMDKWCKRPTRVKIERKGNKIVKRELIRSGMEDCVENSLVSW